MKKTKKIEELTKKLEELQFKVDVMEGALNLIKKDLRVDSVKLTNKEKFDLIGSLKEKYKITRLISYLEIARSSYYYLARNTKKNNKYAEIEKEIASIFYENRRCFGYRKIKAILEKRGIIISEKVILRLMNKLSLKNPTKKQHKYSSSPAVDNVIKRDFSSALHNKKLLTDITEICIPTGKVYLSIIVDCFDGMPVTHRIGVSPTAHLANSTLYDYIKKTSDTTGTIIHSDRGCHYRWLRCRNLIKKHGLV